MGVPKINVAEWPLVLIVYPDSATVDDVDEYLRQFSLLFESRELFGCVVDLNPLTPLQQRADVRLRLANGLDQVYQRFPGIQVAEALIATSALVRGLIVANEWVRRNRTVPRRTFSESAPAIEWARAEIRNAVQPPKTAAST